MKKRIISIILTICMVASIVSVTSVSATAAESCNCLIKCKAGNMNADCPVCSKSGATVDDCKGRISWTESGGSPITTCAQLQNLMSVTGWTDIYYFPLEANITFATWKDIIEVPQGVDVVIDLNGKTLSGNDVGMIFEVSGNLTIIDSKGIGKITHADGGAINILNGGSVLMQGGSIEDNYGGVRVNSGGKFEITGGTMKNNEALYLSFGTSCNITVNSSGTVIIGGDAQILCCDQSGCSCSDNQIAVNTGGTLYVDGGEVKGTVYNKGTIVSTLSGVGTVINGSVDNLGTISAGTYYGEVTNESKGTISGGRFISKVTNNGSISSGKFSSEVDNKGTISGGMYFEDSNVTNTGTISGGIFIGTVAGNGTIEDSAKVPVYFVTDTDKIINTVKVLRGQGIPSANLVSPNPKTYGYNNFNGWRIDSADYTGGGQFINDANYVTAKFSNPITYNITYKLDSGTATNPTSYNVESEAITLKKPTKTDYIFTGWSGTDLTGEDNLTVTIPKGSIGNKTYTAHYIEESILGSVSTEAELKNALDLGVTSIKLVGDFKLSSILDLSGKNITIDLNGHVLSGADILINTGSSKASLTLTDSNPTATHTDSTLPLGGVVTSKISMKQDGGSFHDCILYGNGGTVTSEFTTNTNAVAIKRTSNTPTAFTGKISGYAHLYDGIYYSTIASPVTVHGKKVTFKNGDKDYAYEIVSSGNNVVAPISPSVKAGYQTFDGWYDGDTKYTFGSTLSANITLTAKFSDPLTYNIACDLGGGTATNATSYNVESDAITLNNPAKVGYAFTGWSGTGLNGENNMTVTIPQGSTGNRTYTAHYTEKGGYSVAFDTNGGSDISSKTDVKWTDKVLDGVGTPTKAGYSFVGWKCGETEITANTTYSELAGSDTVLEIMLTAQWEDATVTYGDVNRDGKINLFDLIAMRKYLANWSIEVNTAAADCNADGKINLFDLILMRKYLAKWNVVLGPQA